MRREPPRDQPVSRRSARFRLEGLEDRCLLSITEFPLPTSGGDQPFEIAAGPDGNLWFTMVDALDHGGYLGNINPATDAITEVPLPRH